MSELVGVHGIAKHQLGRHQLLAAWTPALADGLERALDREVAQPPLDLAFYGDVFLDPGRAGGGTGGVTKSAYSDTVSEGMDERELADVVEALTETVSAEDIALAEGAADKGRARMPRTVQVLMRAIDRRFGSAAGVLAVGALRQVRRYLHDGDVKARVDARVEGTVGSKCRVLIGHSLGSVVAYEYLRRNPGHGVELLLTLGSPLGLRMVRRHLHVGALEVPAWVNVRDARDPVACAGPLRTWWPQMGEGDEIVVENGADAHAVERYLNRRATGEVLLGVLPHLGAA
ncbi:hypothetical protein G9272_05950 [Streptomyces asoensis]|uniref:Serine peptidase n=1 Tax=Streptomyces asoensis TaxID=249586 RepID=A0A6M4WHJ7_9ACTN|nr:hypothetical protein [Streptomyces asoensis]QJS99883.1 hypothetical protein G9272_05950 [Streptomyces asoensis]